MFDLNSAICFDCETFPNCFTLAMECLHSDTKAVWEISHYRDDRQALIQWFNWLAQTQTPMVGFNNLNFDYPIIHFLFHNPNATVEQIYEKAMSIINSGENRFGHLIWANERFAPQVDLFTLHHFNNKAKSTGLKGLQINMRAESVVDMPVPVGTLLTKQEIDTLLIPYNQHDVSETKQFTHYSMDALKFRIDLIGQFGVDVLNWNDTKIGTKMMEAKLGENLCYDRSSGRRRTRQTPRTRIALNDIIFPYIQFNNPEFNRVLEYLRSQVLAADEIDAFGQEMPQIKTKGVFTDLKAHVGDIDFYFGTGGIHGSVSSQRVVASGGWIIRDIDVASLYPSIAIVNRLAPEHLGDRFVEVYGQLPKERKEWQVNKGKKCIEANTLKLASNGVYGNSNNMYSPFYDPKYTLTITVNGQLMLCMLAERLLTVPTLTIVQINTDGISYFIHEDYEPQAAVVCREWENLTRLTLEDADYARMFVRDVNSYIAEGTDGSLKIKGAYWTPDPLDWHGSIGAAQPPAWHKNLSNVVSVRAAVAQMVYGVPIEQYIMLCTNPYDFMCFVKVKRSDKLLWGGNDVQRTSRYFISTGGAPLTKIAPPMGESGSYKKANGVSDAEYATVMQETGGAWDARVCTKNKSRHEAREMSIQAGYNVTICNDVRDFNFNDVNYSWYISEARKLLV